MPPPYEIHPESPDPTDTWLFDASRCDVPARDVMSLLDADEHARASSFLFDRDRERFALSHAALRVVVSRYVAIPPRRVAFAKGRHGKPRLSPDGSGVAPPIHFSLSHAGPFTLIAVARGRDVGVDVEHLRSDPHFADMARRVFTSEEAAEIEALPESMRAAAFLRCWVRKEALVKAHGDGLSVPLDGFRVSVDPESPARLLAVRAPEIAGTQWSLADVDVGPAGVGAVAVAGPTLALREFALSDADLRVAAAGD
ncbi:MAG TPA: 4'-phosphopantetheinyl transferase superfamily protein [Gemmatimonadaceae bacterium]|nr:4'-phosphopantetheinyl transferase superfamily protein [Gemmatimonadaceae bacterium]